MNNNKKTVSVSYLAKIAMLSAVGVVLLFLEFPIFPATPFLKLNISDLPSLLATFMFGPISGVVVNAVKVGTCLLMRGTSTGFVGDLSNLVSGSLYVLTAGFIYKYNKTKKGAIIALVVSSVVFCISMWVCNNFFLFPLFGLTDVATKRPLLWWSVLFNIVKTTLTCIATFYLYKSTHKLFDRF